MGGDALAWPEDEILIPRPPLVRVRHAGFNGLVAAGVELARANGAVEHLERGGTRPEPSFQTKT